MSSSFRRFFDRVKRRYIALFFLILLVSALFGAYCLGKSSYETSASLFVELFGVAVELLLIFLVIDVWKNREVEIRGVSVERRLRELLRFWLRENFPDLPGHSQLRRFLGRDHELNQDALASLKEYVFRNGIDEQLEISLQEYCKRERNAFFSSMPIAVSLSDAHFKAWLRITYFVNQIAEGERDAKGNVLECLRNIALFEQASFRKGVYVDAVLGEKPAS